MRSANILAAAALAFGLCACQDLSSPEGAAKAAASAIQKNDLGALKSSLTGNALERYGNAEGLQRLHDMFYGAPHFSMEKPVLKSSEENDHGDIQELFSIELFNRYGHFAELDVDCNTTHSSAPNPGDCAIQPDPHHPGPCVPISHDSTARNCQVSDIHF